VNLLKVIHSSKYRYDGMTIYDGKALCAFVSVVEGHSNEVILVDKARFILSDGSSKYFDSTSKEKTAEMR
jgi:hypothetical protein